jgi:hypothetical protein
MRFQFNFYDHTKLILSREGMVVSVIDKTYKLRTWSLEVLMRPMGEDIPLKERKKVEGVIHKLHYARFVVSSDVSVSAQTDNWFYRDVLAKIQSHGGVKTKTSNIPPVANGKAVRQTVETRTTGSRPLR